MPTGDVVVVDASALVDLLHGGPLGALVRRRLRGTARHAPAHVDAEILSALGGSHRAGEISESRAAELLRLVANMPLVRHPVSALLAGAWARRENVRLVDGLYVELASRLDVPLLTTDLRLARASRLVEAISPQS